MPITCQFKFLAPYWDFRSLRSKRVYSINEKVTTILQVGSQNLICTPALCQSVPRNESQTRTATLHKSPFNVCSAISHKKFNNTISSIAAFTCFQKLSSCVDIVHCDNLISCINNQLELPGRYTWIDTCMLDWCTVQYIILHCIPLSDR